MQNRKLKILPAYLGLFAWLFLGANAFGNMQDPAPLSGLNLEDFQTGSEKNQEWSSNPFIKYGDNPQAKQMRLFGIVVGPNKAMALINSEVVQVGDKIGSSEIVSIERKKVILRNDDGIFQITMKGGAPSEKT